MTLSADTLEDLRQTVARFVAERLIPSEDRLEAEERIPPEILAEMKELGLFGISIPEEYGGLGLTMNEEVTVIFEIGRASPVFRSAFGTNVGIGSQGIVIDGTTEQRERYLPRMARGRAHRLVLPDRAGSGSDAASLRTRRRAATATTTSSTAPSATSPTRRSPASSR